MRALRRLPPPRQPCPFRPGRAASAAGNARTPSRSLAFPASHLVGHARHPPAKNTPIGVAVDGSGTVYVTDAGNNRVLKLPAGYRTHQSGHIYAMDPVEEAETGWGAIC
ncbi:hypothetical protein [Mycobacterium sp.]|uniref:hypothetical protein n=1 Tax=Mycobacterium sp. TaxID=1785 RepID=UPI00261DA995|nr:hypothetical protein [Mycobacterium sp.]